MKYSITFYCYKLEENTLEISISKKDDIYVLTKTHRTHSYEDSYKYTQDVSFIHYISMLHELMSIFAKFYKKYAIGAYPITKMPLAYYITEMCGLSIDTYMERANHLSIKMENEILLYNNIIADITSKLNKAAFRLLIIKIKKENITFLHTLCITDDLIVQFL